MGPDCPKFQIKHIARNTVCPDCPQFQIGLPVAFCFHPDWCQIQIGVNFQIQLISKLILKLQIEARSRLTCYPDWDEIQIAVHFFFNLFLLLFPDWGYFQIGFWWLLQPGVMQWPCPFNARLGYPRSVPDWTQIQIGARLGNPDWSQIAFARPAIKNVSNQ